MSLLSRIRRLEVRRGQGLPRILFHMQGDPEPAGEWDTIIRILPPDPEKRRRDLIANGRGSELEPPAPKEASHAIH